jgi:hypothetical protein
LEEDDLEFLESSWCNRNAHWATFVFAGYKIDYPERQMALVSEWKEELKSIVAQRERVAFMVTVPKLYASKETPDTFFYNTHFFVLQSIVPDNEEEPVRFKIFAGFARHYRMIDYLQEWDLNADIPATHRLKMNRTTYAVESFSQERLFEDFLPQLETMMNEVNTFVWTRTANDIHADLFYADKFKDMIRLQLLGLKKPKQKQAARYSMRLLTYRPENLVETDLDITDGNNIILTTTNDPSITDAETRSQEAVETKPSLTLEQVPKQGFYVPIAKPHTGQYHLIIRRYHYTNEGCTKNADIIRRSCYGPNRKSYKPALPFKMATEDYGAYRERDSLPKTTLD